MVDYDPISGAQRRIGGLGSLGGYIDDIEVQRREMDMRAFMARDTPEPHSTAKPAPSRTRYMIEPTLTEALVGVEIPKDVVIYDDGRPYYRDTGEPVPIVRRPNVLPITRSPDGRAMLAMPHAFDIQGLMAGTGAARAMLGGPTSGVELGIFGGRMAKTADLGALAKAEDMAARGASREEIWNATGWFRGADKKWRFEIDDSRAVINNDALDAAASSYKTDVPTRRAIEHPALMDAYPNIADSNTTIRPLPGGARGMAEIEDASHRYSLASGMPKDDRRSTLLHEFQHGVQSSEDFARGGNNFGLRPGSPAWEIYQERLAAVRNPISEAEFKARGYDSPQFSYSDYLKQHSDGLKDQKTARMLDRAAQDYAVGEGYRRLAGEVEARNVQTRRNMTPAERRTNPPWQTQDVADEQQIVRFGE